MQQATQQRTLRLIHDDGFHVGTIDEHVGRWRATTPSGIQLGTYAAEADAIKALHRHRSARRASH